MSILSPLNERFPHAELYFATKEEFKPLVLLYPKVKKVFDFNKQEGFFGLIKLALDLRKEKFDIVYDAHSNIRSGILKLILKPFSRSLFIQRPKERIKRILLFWFRINKFPKPFRGMKSYLSPLKILGVSQNPTILSISNSIVLKKWVSFEKFIVLAPSAAWELKRWPLDYWKKLIELCPKEKFVILGGPNDKFCVDLQNIDPSRCISLAGSLSFMESTYIVSKADMVISGDTGIIHVADLLGIKGIALIGPSAFGYPTGDHIKVLERPLDCRPCTKDGRGKCTNPEFKKCLVDIKPNDVAYLASSWATKRS
jgi:ADP-heptose:LPS heptosyltransferase